MNVAFYNADDPFAKDRQLDQAKYGVDHFYQRLLIAKDRINSKSGKQIAERRTKFLLELLDELRREIDGE